MPDMELNPWLAYLALVNLIALLLFGYDKRAAKHRIERISERTLLFVSLLGGWPAGLLASYAFRHKTAKRQFRIQLYAVSGISCLVCVWIIREGYIL